MAKFGNKGKIRQNGKNHEALKTLEILKIEAYGEETNTKTSRKNVGARVLVALKSLKMFNFAHHF